MSTYIVFSMGEPKYRVEAYFYDVDKHFMSFYDEDNNLIVSINVDEIDCVLDKEQSNNFHIIEPVDDDCEDCEKCEECDDVECEFHPSNNEENKEPEEIKDNRHNYTATLTFKPTEGKSTEVDFDALFKRVLGLHGEK